MLDDHVVACGFLLVEGDIDSGVWVGDGSDGGEDCVGDGGSEVL